MDPKDPPPSPSRLRRGYNRAPRGALEVRLDRRLRAAETVGDLPDREAFGLTIVTRQSDRTTALCHPVD